MVDFITYLWAAFSLVILCFLIFVVAGAAGLTGWLQVVFQAAA